MSSLCKLLNIIGQNHSDNGENFRASAYFKASKILKGKDGITGSEARKLRGIGAKIEKKINEFNRTGTIADAFKVNEILKLFTSIHGVGPVKAKEWIKDGYKTLDDLKEVQMTHAQRLGYDNVDDLKERIPRSEIAELELYIKDKVPNSVICGSYRRGHADSGDIDLLVKGGTIYSVVDDLKDILVGTLSLGKTKFMGLCILSNKVRRIDILVVNEESWYYSLLYFTGSKELNIKMRNVAKDMGLTLNEYRLGNVEVNSEEEIFKILGMKYLSLSERDLKWRSF
uniref:DNA polymerase family X n=1 Tax=Pithovirus LCPAC403 TaxID=2506596 RepID=A0A481ZAQ8_9VIRU|nr:MAG: DNA polymerase family X [Pithovirus LCPAC403]